MISLRYVFACLSFAGILPGADYRIVPLSTPAEMVSGGSVLIRVEKPDSVAADSMSIRVNGSVIKAPNGLVTGLKDGPNVIELLRRQGEDEGSVAKLQVVNHPITGPVFSGPQEKPFICQTQAFRLPDGSSLGLPLDENCSVATRIDYVYKRVGAKTFTPLPDRTAVPDDATTTTTTLGATVPYIVRVETGTINRAIYQIAVLHNPAAEPEPAPGAALTAWNKRLLYSFGGGCIRGWYRQGSTLGVGSGVMISDAVTGKGYAEASSSLNVFGNNCNDLTAAETMMMVREHFIKTFGMPLFTFGRGGSGGSYQQLQIADNYPGLLDGIIPSATFPDVLENTQYLTDVQLLDHYYKDAGAALTAEQKRAIAGVAVLANVTGPAPEGARIQATTFCPPELTVTQRYDPVRNRGGARCDVFDHAINVYGRDANTGFAMRPIDNVGVQYGLAALNDGVITTEQFLDLNQDIGGYDGDGNMIPSRAVADLPAVRAAYSTGRVLHGGSGLAEMPIIDLRNYQDQTTAGNLHLRYHSFSLRERLRASNGNAGNHIMITGGTTDEYAIHMMDEWLTTRQKPADLVDSCYTPAGERVVEPQLPMSGQCGELYPAFPSPRMVAGGPASNNVLKCQLKPIDMTDYNAAFTPAQEDRLRAVFRDGVCDWSKPGAEQQRPADTWLSF